MDSNPFILEPVCSYSWSLPALSSNSNGKRVNVGCSQWDGKALVGARDCRLLLTYHVVGEKETRYPTVHYESNG